MKHHFGDFLDRTADYWTTIPNRDRYAFVANFKISNKDEVKILTISKNQDKEHWGQIFDCPNLEELTLHDPSKEQVQAVRKLPNIKRLRVTFFRAIDIEFIGDLANIEELILEYVSGFSDLTPLLKLTKLKSLQLENLRRVSNFDGLKGLKSLRYLQIDGTLDWSQPIENFNFLEGIENLEVLALGFITNKSEFPALLPVLKLKNLKKIMASLSTFSTKEFAFLEVALPNTFLCDFSNTKLKSYVITSRDYVYFLGKGTRSISSKEEKAQDKIKLFEKKYDEYKSEAEKLIKNYCG
jgi:Leucine-rich repeat (LRR) protein